LHLRPPVDAASLERWLRYCKEEGVPCTLSLARLARECAAAQDERGRLPGYLARLRGLNAFVGFAITEDDVLLLGVRDESRQPLYVDDVVHTIRAAWLGTTPVCSLEPDETDPGRQVCYIAGVARASFLADSILAADIRMKIVSLGLIRPGVKVPSFVDLVVERRKRDPDAPGGPEANRWWFTCPPWDVPRTVAINHDRVVLLTKNPVVIRTEKAAGGGKKWGTGETSPAAEAFAVAFTYHLGALAQEYPEIDRLLLLFRLRDLAVHLRHFLKGRALPGGRYWLEGYRSNFQGPPESMRSLERQARFRAGDNAVTLKVTGGVRMAARPPKTIDRPRLPEGGRLSDLIAAASRRDAGRELGTRYPLALNTRGPRRFGLAGD
jgi:hypothetical protein